MGPNTFIFSSDKISVIPLLRGPSGPMTTKSGLWSIIISLISEISSISTSIVLAISDTPAFSPKHMISSTLLSLDNLQIIACSLAPDPTTKTFMYKFTF